MKNRYAFLTFLALLAFSISVSATDYAVDPTFNPTFVFPEFNVDESISDVLVLPDGKILVGGNFTQVNGEPVNFLVRLNPNGTRDTLFNSAITPSSGLLTYVKHLTLLADGKYLVTGNFKINGQYSGFVKLNSDGSIDGSLNNYAFLSDVNQRLVPLPDGKYIACGGRLINNEPYNLAYRMNADGSPDPTFRVTFGQGSCSDIQLQPDGKILISGSIHNGNYSYYEPLHRLNADGSRDATFNLQTTSGYGAIFNLLPDGKIIATYGDSQGSFTTRFNSDGSRDIQYPECLAQGFLPVGGGNILMAGCRKWTTGPPYQFASVRQDGWMDRSVDWISFQRYLNDSQGIVKGIRSAAGGKYYAFGNFNAVDGQARAKIVRLMPYAAPIKAKFDFDGDGRSDIAIFRPSDRTWYVSRSSAGAYYLPWGLASDPLAAADYDFDGKTDVGVYRDGVWYGFGSTVGYTYVVHGQASDKPLIGDFDNDGKNDWAIRKSANGAVSWNILRGGLFYGGGTIAYVTGELENDRPIVGDFDGDHRDELGYFRDGYWFMRDYLNGAPTESFRWGSTGDIPVPADYDGDGQTDFAVYRPSTGVWWINQSSLGVYAAAFGLNGDVPVPADYDGDGKTDIAIFRNGQWWQFLSGSSSYRVDPWGVAGDIPIPAQGQ
jgi:uncharacterized delta-60 repeat protein